MRMLTMSMNCTRAVWSLEVKIDVTVTLNVSCARSRVVHLPQRQSAVRRSPLPVCFGAARQMSSSARRSLRRGAVVTDATSAAPAEWSDYTAPRCPYPRKKEVCGRFSGWVGEGRFVLDAAPINPSPCPAS